MHRELSNHCILTQIEGFAVIIFNKGFVYGGFCSLIAWDVQCLFNFEREKNHVKNGHSALLPY